jgi:DNA ligase (NAD+)
MYEINESIVEKIKLYKKNGLKSVILLNENIIIEILKYLDENYFNSEYVTMLNDSEYDLLRDYAKHKYGNNSYFNCIGYSIQCNEKAKLPIFMGSMDKIKPDTNDLTNWLKKYKGKYIISAKLDGVSGLYVKEKSVEKLYTRGDGMVGKDISHLIPFLKLPNLEEDVMIRGEFIMKKNIFEEKYELDYSNIRNLVSGIINTKIINEKIKDVHFVIYEVIHPQLKPLNQLEYLKNHCFEVVNYIEKEMITDDLLKNHLLFLKKEYIYEIDGLIITNNEIYERKIGNPEHSIAYKIILNDQIREAIVKDVIWTPSKDGYLKPRIEIEPLIVGNVKITFLNGFNGAYIKNNKINIGSKLSIIRSGEVIPHILEIKSFSEEGKMPNVSYKWNESLIDIILEDLDNEVVKKKKIVLFLKTIGVEDVSEGIVKKIIEHGYDSIEKIVYLKIDDFLKINGFQEKLANKIYNGIKNSLENVGLEELMVASSIFIRGTSIIKIKCILENFQDILDKNMNDVEKINRIIKIKGMSLKTATEFVERLPIFIDFCERILDKNKINQLFSTKKENIIINHELYKKNIVITGFRDNKLKEWIESVGGIIGTNISNKTYIVITSVNNNTNKVKEAKKLKIPIFLLNDFIKKYGNVL